MGKVAQARESIGPGYFGPASAWQLLEERYNALSQCLEDSEECAKQLSSEGKLDQELANYMNNCGATFSGREESGTCLRYDCIPQRINEFGV